MKTIEIEIQGISPLLMNRFHEENEITKKMRKKEKKDYGSSREQAEKASYFDDSTKFLFIPSEWIKGTLKSVSSDFKLPSSRKSVKSIIGGAVIPLEEKIYFKEQYKLKDIEIDSRPVVIQRARIMKHRPKLEKWNLLFNLMFDDSLLDESSIHEMLSESGRRSGIGDYRPQKGGPFGRFQITKWKVL